MPLFWAYWAATTKEKKKWLLIRRYHQWNTHQRLEQLLWRKQPSTAPQWCALLFPTPVLVRRNYAWKSPNVSGVYNYIQLAGTRSKEGCYSLLESFQIMICPVFVTNTRSLHPLGRDPVFVAAFETEWAWTNDHNMRQTPNLMTTLDSRDAVGRCRRKVFISITNLYRMTSHFSTDFLL